MVDHHQEFYPILLHCLYYFQFAPNHAGTLVKEIGARVAISGWRVYFVTVEEFCDFTGLKVEQVVSYLSLEK